MGVFVKPNNRVEKGNIICTYSDLPTTSVHGIDHDYHFQVLSGAKTIHYDGFRVKHCQLGPLVNDISFTCFVKTVADAVKHEDRSMFKYVFSTHSRFRERCNSSVRTLKTSLILIATKRVADGHACHVLLTWLVVDAGKLRRLSHSQDTS